MARALFILLLVSLVAPGSLVALPVIPGAEGFGVDTPAGSGRHLNPPKTSVIKVTKTEDSGPGSLRACVEAEGPRVCVFEAGGDFRLKKTLSIRHPYLTVAGQTAPSPGVNISRANVEIASHDILLQHLEILVGDDRDGPAPESRDGVTIGRKDAKVFNVTLDHLTVGWAIDENMSTYGSLTRDVTVQYSIILEGLHDSIHPKGPHGKGFLIGDDTKRITLHHLLFANNHDRNPRLKAGAEAEVIDNVFYGWGGRSGWNAANVSDTEKTGRPIRLVFGGNLFLPGPESPRYPPLYGTPLDPNTRIFAEKNEFAGAKGEGDDWTRITEIPAAPFRAKTPPFPRSSVEITSPEETKRRVFAEAGARPKERSPVAARVVKEALTGGGSIKNCILGCLGAAGGRPSFTESKRALTLPSNPHKDDDKDGYTNLEEWLGEMAQKVER